MTHQPPRDERSRAPIQGTLEDELEHHRASHVDELMRGGMARPDAERAARRRLGDLQRVRRAVARERVRDDRRLRLAHWFADLRQDTAVGFRRLLRSPAFTAIAVLTLALGIGANSALFGVIHQVVLRPLPFADPDRLVRVWESEPSRGWDYFAMSGPNFLDYRAAARERVDLAAVGLTGFNLTGGELPERIDGYRMSANLPAVLGIEPLHGRGFAAAEDAPGADPAVALVGYGLWQRRFAADPTLVGRSLRLDGRETRVVGILPPLAPLLVDDALFVPLNADPTGNRSHHDLMGVGRAAAGIEAAQVESLLDTVAGRLAAQYPASNEGFDTRVMSLYDALVPEDTRTALYILLGAVALVLLVACANLSGLMLARIAARRRELAIYGALGASRGRVARQVLTEALLLSGAGALVGVFLASAATRWIRQLHIAGLPRIDQVTVNTTVVAFTATVAIVAGLLAALLPAYQAIGGRLAELLSAGGRGATSSERAQRFRAFLMAAEVALAVVLLAGAGLLLRSFLLVQGQESGLDVEPVLTAELAVPLSSDDDLRGRVATYRTLLEAIEGQPGIDVAAAVSAVPFGPGATVMDFLVEGRTEDPQAGVPSAGWRLVTPEYFRALGIELVAGRGFDSTDDPDGQAVAIVSRRMAERHWPDEDPLGRTFLGWRDRPLRIVGVAEDVRERDLESEPANMVYLPYYQNPWWADMFLVARTAGDPSSAAPALRQTLARVAPDLPLAFLRPLSQVLDESMATRRFSTVLLTIFAAIALVLAAAGVYGVVSYGVASRRPEIGVRMALGARARSVVALVIRQGMGAVAIGGVLGLAGALAGGRLLASQLYGIDARDPLAFGAAMLFLTAVALLACALPAARAARVDPVDTLRES